MTTKEESAFIAELNKNEKDLADLAGQDLGGGGFMDDAELIELLGLEEDVEQQHLAKLSRIRFGIDKNKERYFAFNFTITDGEHAGTTVSRFFGLLKPSAKKADREKRMKQCMGMFQRLDIDTSEWTKNPGQHMVDAAKQLTKDKPSARIGLGVWGDDADRLNLNVIGMVASTSANGQPETEYEDAETEETVAEMSDGTAPDEWIGYVLNFDSGDGEASGEVTAWDDGSKLFTITDEDDTEYEVGIEDVSIPE